MKKTTREWVEKAEADYRGAKKLAPGRPPMHDLVCFHCQQTASALRWAGDVRDACRAVLGLRPIRRSAR